VAEIDKVPAGDREIEREREREREKVRKRKKEEREGERLYTVYMHAYTECTEGNIGHNSFD